MDSWSPEGLLILVVEEDDLIREALREFLAATFSRCVVLDVGIGDSASSSAKSQAPDVIVVDVSLPKHDNMEIIRELRSVAPSACIVALTRRDGEACQDLVRSAGASTCILIWEIRERLASVLEEQFTSDAERGTLKTVICVEDDPEMIDLIKLILRRHSFDAIGALGGHEAFDTIRHLKPDLVLLDLMMPDVSGWDVYQQLKAEQETKDIPVIVVSVLDPYWSRRRGLAPTDVDGYLVKPFLPQALVEEVHRTLQR